MTLPLLTARRMAALLVTALLLAVASIAALAPAPDAHAANYAVTAKSDTFEANVLAKINEKRKAAGKAALKDAGSCLDSFAESWAKYLAQTGQNYHQDLGPISKKCTTVTQVAEILVSGTGLTPQQAADAWMGSDAHKKIMLSGTYTKAVVGAWQNELGDVYISVLLRT